jgi:hypothetical protein
MARKQMEVVKLGRVSTRTRTTPIAFVIEDGVPYVRLGRISLTMKGYEQVIRLRKIERIQRQGEAVDLRAVIRKYKGAS